MSLAKGWMNAILTDDLYINVTMTKKMRMSAGVRIAPCLSVV